MTGRILAGATVVVVAALAVVAVRHWRERPADPPLPLRGSWTPSPAIDVGAGSEHPFELALSPDGRKLAYPAAHGGGISLWLDDLVTGKSAALPLTDGAAAPFWSTDGRRVGFFSGDRVRAIDLESGTVRDIADARAASGAAWNAAGDLVTAPDALGALVLRTAAGAESHLTTLDTSAGETSHRWPAFLPDGLSVVFFVRATQPAREGVWLVPIDNPSARRRLFSSDAQAMVAGSTLVFANGDALMAQPLDPRTWDPFGRAELVGLPVGRGPLGQLFAAASSDVLIYGPPGTSLRELQWVNRDGTPAGRAGEPVEAWDSRISPDGQRVAITELDPQIRSLDVWLQDRLKPLPVRLSLSIDADRGGAWSPDGSRVAWITAGRRVTVRGAGAVLPEQTLATFEPPVQIWDWSRDAGWLVIGRHDPDTQEDLWLLPQAEIPPRAYARIPFNQAQAAVSPDSRWMAYASDESGKFDVYIDSFPTAGARTRVTTAGGTEPRWRRDGQEVYFRRGSEIHAVALDVSAHRIEARTTTRLFDAATDIRAYDATADGQRFLLNVPAASAAQRPFTMVSNWRPRTGHRDTETQR